MSACPSACLLPTAGSCFLAGGSSSGPVPLCWAGHALAPSHHPWVLGSGSGRMHTDSCSPQIKVMHKQLLLFHNAISAYFAGNQQQLEQTLKQFNIKLKTPGAEKPSWLEEQ